MKQITELREKDRQTERIHTALRSDVYGPDVFKALREGQPHESIVAWLERESGSPQQDTDGYSPAVDPPHDAYPSAEEMSAMPSTYWTSVKCDPTILRHLFKLYFTWIQPTMTVLSERHFCESYDRQSIDFCSPLLVNAMCALACKLHDHQNAEDDFFVELGENFTDAFREDFDPADKRITTIQATAVMFMVELSKGSARAAAYLKMATDSITEVSALAGTNVPGIVLKTTIQGIRCLNV